MILQRAANRQGGLAAAAAARSAAAEGDGGPQLHKNSFKCSKCHRVGATVRPYSAQSLKSCPTE